MMADARQQPRAAGTAWLPIGSLMLMLLAAPQSAQAQTAPCGSTHPYVGFTGEFSSLEHSFGGTVTILSDCEFRVDNFTYDGQAPEVFWYGATTVDDIFDSGFQISDTEVTDAADGITVTLRLSEGVTWERVGAISLWCVVFDADFGNVMLEAATPAQAAAVAAPAAGTAGPTAAASAEPTAREPSAANSPPPAARPLANCATLTGRYFVYWELDSPDPERATSVRMALEGRVEPGHWMGFGFNAPDLDEVRMPGSDVVVAGVVGTEGFAHDYYLQSRVQCNYADGGDVGVCPDSSALDSPAANNVELTGFSNEDGVLRVEFTKPLNASDRLDRQWIVSRERPITWAMGPLSEASTAENPIVLYHVINGESINAPPDFKLDLGEPQFDCDAATGSGPGASSGAVGGNVSSIANVTVFNVTTGPNLNYPNPPAWGLSYHVNGLESPLLRVVRGTEYTFNVMASMQHPLYLTTSGTGGAGRADSTDETVFAGGGDSAGTIQEPFVLTWTPNDMVPDSLYYQCHTHQKLGWKVEVYDAGDAAGLVSNTTNVPAPAAAEGSVSGPASGPSATPTTATPASAPAPAPAGQGGSVLAPTSGGLLFTGALAAVAALL